MLWAMGRMHHLLHSLSLIYALLYAPWSEPWGLGFLLPVPEHAGHSGHQSHVGRGEGRESKNK